MGFKPPTGIADDVVKRSPSVTSDRQGRSVYREPEVLDAKRPDEEELERPVRRGEKATWADSAALDGLYARGEVPMNSARAAFDSGKLTRSEYEWTASGVGEEDQRTRYEKIMMYKDHRGGLLGNMENAVGLLETVGGHRAMVSGSSAILEGLKDHEPKEKLEGFSKFANTAFKVGTGVDIAGFGRSFAFSPEEFKRAWGARTSYSDVFAKGGWDPGKGLASWGFVRGLTADILLDPTTWLTFGVATGAKVTIRSATKAAEVMSKSAAKAGVKNADAFAKGANLSTTRYGADILKIASKHLVKQSNSTKAVREGALKSKEAVAKATGVPDNVAYDFYQRGRDGVSEFIGARNRQTSIPSFLDEVYAKHGVDSSSVLPEHIGKMMDDPNFAARFSEWTIENFDVFALEHLDLMRGGQAKGMFSKIQGATKGDLWTPRGLASRANLQRGPASMFQETAGMLGKERGIPIDDMMGSLSQSLRGVEANAAEKISKGVVSPKLAAATTAVGWSSGKAHGVNETLRKWFTASIERAPLEDRLIIQGYQDAATNEMLESVVKIRTKFDEPINYTNSLGNDVSRKISDSERKLLSRHLEQPAKHVIPDELKPVADWASQQFDEMWKAEEAVGIAGKKIEDYVAHIYGSGSVGRRMKILKKMNMGPEALRVGGDTSNIKINAPFAYHRTIATLDDAVEWFGEGAVELDLAQILTRRKNISIKAIAKQRGRARMVERYRLGGLTQTMLMEGQGFRQLMKSAVNYNRNFVDVVAHEPASVVAFARLDRVSDALADIDFKKLRKISDHKRKQPTAVREEGSEKTLIQSRVTSGQMAEDLPWFNRSMPKSKRKKHRKKSQEKHRVGNRKKLSQITRTVFGKKLADISEGEAAYLADFLTGWAKPILMKSKASNQLIPSPGWRAKDAIVLTKFDSGLITKDVYDFGYAGDINMGGSSRLIPKKREEIPFDQARTARSILKRRGVEPLGPMRGAEATESPMSQRWAPGAYTDEAAAAESRQLKYEQRLGFSDPNVIEAVEPGAKSFDAPLTMTRQAKETKQSGKEFLPRFEQVLKEDALNGLPIDKYNLELFQRILPHLKDKSIDIHSVRVGSVGPRSIVNRRGVAGLASMSFLEKGKGNVYLKSAAVGGKGMRPETVLHELIHVATVMRLKGGKQLVNSDTELGRAYNSLNGLAAEVFPRWKERMFGEVFREGMPRSLDVDELIAWGLTNPKFQRFLRGLPAKREPYASKKNVTVWSKFIKTVRSILGIPDEYENAFTRLVQHTNELLDADLKGVKAETEYGEYLQSTAGKGGRDYSVEQMEDALASVSSRRAEAGLTVGKMERRSLLRTQKKLAGEAAGLKKKARELSKGIESDAARKLEGAEKKVDDLTGLSVHNESVMRNRNQELQKLGQSKFPDDVPAQFQEGSFINTHYFSPSLVYRYGKFPNDLPPITDFVSATGLKSESPRGVTRTSTPLLKKQEKVEASFQRRGEALSKRKLKTTQRAGNARGKEFLAKDKLAAYSKSGKETKRKAAQQKIVDNYKEKIAKADEAVDVVNADIEKYRQDLAEANNKWYEELADENAEWARWQDKADGYQADLDLKAYTERLKGLSAEKKTKSDDVGELLGKRRTEFDKTKQDISGEFFMPESIVDSLNDLMDSGFDFTKPHHRALRWWQDFQKTWKIPLTLPFMEHHMRNALTNVGLTMAKVGIRLMDPRIWRTSANVSGYLLFKSAATNFGNSKGLIPEGARKAMLSKVETLKKEWDEVSFTDVHGAEHSVKDIADQALKRGINHGFVHSELGVDGINDIASMADGRLIGTLNFVWDTLKGGAKKASNMSEQVFDVPFRMAMFTDEVMKGSTYDEAAEAVRVNLNDWARLGNNEKLYMRTAQPFWSWYQFSLERAFKDFIARPGSFAAPFKTTNNLQKSYMSEEPPPGYQPSFISERLGIWTPPNDHGYYSKLVGFGLNQEEALRQASAYGDFARLLTHEAIGIINKDVANKVTAGPVPPERAALRVLGQMDFIGKSIAEAVRGRQFFDNSVTGTRPELLLLERSRLESGKGFEDLDKGFMHNLKATGMPGASAVAGIGGKWIKEWFDYQPEDPGVKTSRVMAYRRWIIGQTPVTRFVSTYQSRVAESKLGKVNYKTAALHALGMDIYKFHPSEGKYFRDRARINAVAHYLRQAHLMDNKILYWNKSLSGDPDAVTQRALDRIRSEMEANPKSKKQ